VAVHAKLDAIADGLADLMAPSRSAGDDELARDASDLREAVGVEHPT
jgi:hypothetical protein